MIKLPLFAKLIYPGYRKKWQSKCVSLIDHLNEISSMFEYGSDEDIPWIESRDKDLRFYGFWTDSAKGDVYTIIQPFLNDLVTRPYFRLLLDYVNRYMYPHMRPDLRPQGYTVDQMFGFHGQQKDAVMAKALALETDTIDKAFSLKNDDVIINCGAFIGFGDIHLSKELKNGKIYALEADRTCFSYLKKNLMYNKIMNVSPINRAVWNTQTELTFHTGYAQANSLVEDIHDWDNAYSVKTITIDELVEEKGLSRVSMLSLTLNGAEIEALEGATETISRFKPRIRLAGWYKRDGELICDLTKKQLEKHGYKVIIGPRNGVCAIG